MSDETGHDVEIHRVLRQERELEDNYTTAAGTRDDAVVLMHSPMGVRVCLNIRERRLELWLSPQAGKSINARLRNFSNRDDYTCIFDRVAMPGLAGEAFQRCRYDPFYSVVEYEHQALHLLSLASHAGVAMWFDAPEVIDFKSDKEDTRTRADERTFAVRHPDRGLRLEMAAVLGKGQGSFTHQKDCDFGRSTYARAELQPGQVLLIGGELETESPAEDLELLAGFEGAELVAANEKAIAPLLREGRAVFRGRDDWQGQYDLNRRVLLSCQDYGGAMPAALRALYYLIWHMDGALTAVSAGYCGWQSFLGRWARFEASNPTEADGPVAGRFFGQLVTRRISKQEEWGLYWTVWSLFAWWSQTGSDALLTPTVRRNLDDALDWMDRVCWDEGAQAFGTWYQGEDPFEGSYDAGSDAAVGAPMGARRPGFEGQAIRRAYIFEMNLMMYNVFLMLSAMSDDDGEAEALLGRARSLEDFLATCRSEGFSRRLILADGSEALDRTPPRYAPGAPFVSDFSDLVDLIKGDPRHDLTPVLEGREVFAHQVLSNIAVQDPALFGAGNLEKLMDIYLPQITRSGAVLKMPGTLVENINCADGSYHDNRPQLFATGLLQYSMVGRGLWRMPLGIAVRANGLLQRVEGYAWLGRELTVEFEGAGTHVAWIDVEDLRLTRTLQIPDQLPEGSIKVLAGLTTEEPEASQLIYSTMRLVEVEESPDGAVYVFEAVGKNVAAFTRSPGPVELTGPDGSAMEPEAKECFGWHVLEWPGRGRFKLRVE